MSDEDTEMMRDLILFAHSNDIHCFTAMVRQLENNGLERWAECVHRNSEFWIAYFHKWSQNCEGCNRTDGEFLDGLDWSID